MFRGVIMMGVRGKKMDIKNAFSGITKFKINESGLHFRSTVNDSLVEHKDLPALIKFAGATYTDGAEIDNLDCCGDIELSDSDSYRFRFIAYADRFSVKIQDHDGHISMVNLKDEEAESIMLFLANKLGRRMIKASEDVETEIETKKEEIAKLNADIAKLEAKKCRLVC